jgi:hypothetical protein
MSRVKPPYPGQGAPLPKTMKLNGVWVIENIVALTIDEPSIPDGEGVFQRAPKSPKGNNVFTVDARLLAMNFEISLDDLLVENRAGRLLLKFDEGPGRTAVLTFFCRGIESAIDFEGFTEQ